MSRESCWEGRTAAIGWPGTRCLPAFFMWVLAVCDKPPEYGMNARCMPTFNGKQWHVERELPHSFRRGLIIYYNCLDKNLRNCQLTQNTNKLLNNTIKSRYQCSIFRSTRILNFQNVSRKWYNAVHNNNYTGFLTKKFGCVRVRLANRVRISASQPKWMQIIQKIGNLSNVKWFASSCGQNDQLIK